MTNGERVKQLRKELNYSQEYFGERLGVGKTAISKIEKGENALTEQMAKSISREFNANYNWLVNGDGPMFDDVVESVLSEAKRKYDLDELDVIILDKYLHLTADKKKVFKEYFKSIIEEEKKMQETKKDELK